MLNNVLYEDSIVKGYFGEDMFCCDFCQNIGKDLYSVFFDKLTKKCSFQNKKTKNNKKQNPKQIIFLKNNLVLVK